jgi:cytochrome c oxidase cbb3-type subunit 2
MTAVSPASCGHEWPPVWRSGVATHLLNRGGRAGDAQRSEHGDDGRWTHQAPAGVTSVPLPKRYGPAHGVVVPSHKAQALIAYLASLKQPPVSEAEAATGDQAMADMASPTTRTSAPASANLAPPVGGYDAAKGAALFTANCSACHQASGEGLPGAFPSLKGDAVVNNDDATKHIHVVLNGLHDAKVGGVVYGSAMPPFAGSLSDVEVADIIDYERSSWGNHGKPVIAAQVAAERGKAK